MPDSPSWDIGGSDVVPMVLWGKDHWSTLAYVENRVVDHRGMLHHDNMRVDVQRHPLFASARRHPLTSATRYPTRLKTADRGRDGSWGVVELFGHDDYDCLNDAIRLNLVTVTMPAVDAAGNRFVDVHGRPIMMDGEVVRPSFVTGLGEWALMAAASFGLTELGRAFASDVRAHIAAGRNPHQFMPAVVVG